MAFLELFAQNNSPYKPSPEKVVSAKNMADTEVDFDFSALILAFPRNRVRREDAEPKTVAQICDYIAELEGFYQQKPLLAFKVVAILLILDNYALNQFAIRDVFGLFERWCKEGKVNCKDKIEIGTQLWIAYRHSRPAHFKEDSLLPLLMPLYLEKSITEPAYIVEKFEWMANQKGGGGDFRGYLFTSSSCVENPDDFLQLARNVHHLKPKLLLRALHKCLFEGRRLYQTALKQGREYHYQPSEQHLRGVANELFEKRLDSEGPEYTYQRLIIEAYPDEGWYSQLWEELWQIERAKPKQDAQTLTNSFLMVMHVDANSPVYLEAKEKIEDWAVSYKALYLQGKGGEVKFDTLMFWLDDQTKFGLMVSHAKSLLDRIDDAMTLFYPKTRNLSLPVPQTHEVMAFLENTYWQMVAWLLTENQFIALRVLVVGFQTHEDFHINSSLTNQVSQKAEAMFMSIFERYHTQHIDETALLLELIINYSRFSDCKKKLGKLLDKIFPMFEQIAPDAALAAYERAHKNDGSHSWGWYYRKKT